MRTRIVILVVAAAAVLTAGAFAGEVLGRDVARDGALTTLSGNLVYEQDEWFLQAADGDYELHMGPFGHDESLPFTDGAAARVLGFLIPEHIAPVSVETDGRRHEFWHESRYPLWAGNGERRNAVETAARGEPAGRRIQVLDEEPEQEPQDPEAPRGWAWKDDFEPAYRNQELRPGRGR